ncbi:MAG TPA: hypothetical protein VI076_15575, partial [Actinopolymorphaceae bacterium]
MTLDPGAVRHGRVRGRYFRENFAQGGIDLVQIALLSVGTVVILNAVAATLAHPDPASVVAGEDLDPVTPAVVTSVGSWSSEPF